MKITFVLPCGGPSGGVRVTVEMARRLVSRGHSVRIAYRAQPVLSRERILDSARRVLRRLERAEMFDWLTLFKSGTEAFRRLDALQFEDGEVVIAVGERTIADVHQLNRNVIKLRYCHGFFDELEELNQTAYGVPMPTICVSPSLVSRLENYSGDKVLAIVPNGIDVADYYSEKQVRDGLGLIYHDIPIKGPEVARALVNQAEKAFPGVPWYMFGTGRRPAEFAQHYYQRYPAVEKAREIYSRARIWVVTSRNEGFCLPILEAMACGCAVISSNHTNATQLIQDGINGFIVPFGDVSAYMQRLKSLWSDDALRQRFVERGLATARNFSWDAAVDKMERVLRQLQGEAVPA